jgi:hypothetical protein
MPDWKAEFNKCNDSKLCIAEVDAKARGTWFFQMDFIFFNKDGGNIITTLAAFEVLQFSPTFSELDLYEEDEVHQLKWSIPSIYTKLNRIKNGESMAFVKMRDSFSTEIANARQSHKSIGKLNFSLKKFTTKGGVMARFDLEMESVFILDIKQSGAAEKVLITFGKTNFAGTLPAEKED